MAEQIEFSLKVTKDELENALVSNANNVKKLGQTIDDISKKDPFSPLSRAAIEMGQAFRNDTSILSSFNKTLDTTSRNALDSSKDIDSLTDELNNVAYASKKSKEGVESLGAQLNLLKGPLAGNLNAQKLGQSIDEISKKDPFAALSRSAIELGQLVRNDTSVLASFNKTLDTTSRNALDSSRGIDSLTDELNNVAYASKKSTEEVGYLGVQLSRVKESFVGNLGADIVGRALNLLGQGFDKVINDTAQFSKAVSQINSVLPSNVRLTKEQSDALKELSEQFGTSAAAQAQGLFEPLSKGIDDVAVSMDILKKANDAALAGLVDINTASRLITSTMYAFSNQSLTAAQVTDTLVAVTQESGVTFEDLSQSMGRVLNVASQSNVSIGELGGAIAFLDKKGLTAEQSITGLAGIFSEISKPSVEAAARARSLGIEFNAAALKAKGLVGFLQDLTEKTGGSATKLRQLFADTRAGNAIIAIANSEFSKFKETIDKVTASQGEAARAAKVIKESFSFKLDELGSSLNSLAITIGEKLVPLLPILTGSVRAFSSTFKTFAPVDPITKINNELERTNKIIEILRSGSKQGLAQLGIDASVLTNEKLNKLLSDQIALRDSIKVQKVLDAKSPVADGKVPTKDSPVEDTRTLQEINATKERQIQINALNRQFEIEQENATAEFSNVKIQNELLRNEAEIQRNLEFETLKKESEFQVAEEKAGLIGEETLRNAELARIGKERELEFTKISNKAIIAEEKSKFERMKNDAFFFKKFEDKTAKEKLSDLQDSFATISTLSSSHNKGLAIIGKAAAIANSTISGYVAVGKALESAPPPYNFALAALVGTAAAANTAKIAGVGFADGGFVGGALGASVGPDNKVASIRTGEMILNAEDQLTVLKAIKSGSFGGSGDIIIQINSREIARAVRSEMRSGFVMA